VWATSSPSYHQVVRIKELFVALLATYGAANEVVMFVVGRGDTTDELELESVASRQC
jgi:hypothetical protein